MEQMTAHDLLEVVESTKLSSEPLGMDSYHADCASRSDNARGSTPRPINSPTFYAGFLSGASLHRLHINNIGVPKPHGVGTQRSDDSLPSTRATSGALTAISKCAP